MKANMKFIKNHGGREKYFSVNLKKHKTNDCVIRAIAIATEIDYLKVRDSLFDRAKSVGRMPNDKEVYEAFLKDNGWIKNSPIKNSKGKKYKVKDFPVKNCIVHTTNHLTVIKDGALNDTWNCMEWCANSYYTKNPLN